MIGHPVRRTAVGIVLVLAVVLAAGAWWFTGRGDDDDRADVSTTWSFTKGRDVPVAAGDGFRPEAVVEGDGLLVAAGDAPEPSGDGDDLDAWYSTDGATWTRSDLRSVSRGAGWYSEFTDLLGWGGGFLVTGKGIDSSGGLPVVASVPTFFSADGRTWRLLDPPPGAGGRNPGYFADGAHAYASPDGVSLWRLDEAGERWKAVAARAPKGCTFGIRSAASDAGEALVTGGCGSNDAKRLSLYRVTDGGARLRDLSAPLPRDLVGVPSVAVREDTLLLSARQQEPPSKTASPPTGGGGGGGGGARGRGGRGGPPGRGGARRGGPPRRGGGRGRGPPPPAARCRMRDPWSCGPRTAAPTGRRSRSRHRVTPSPAPVSWTTSSGPATPSWPSAA
ncbi:hypothetical protein ACFV0R_01270 [Streptomyces sp. NPDC059578]|uniref:hypothetical protein n=1 Tax=Streptomyces sp. NPDC059578 TaxID=3346874 RepID=UPI003692197A